MCVYLTLVVEAAYCYLSTMFIMPPPPPSPSQDDLTLLSTSANSPDPALSSDRIGGNGIEEVRGVGRGKAVYTLAHGTDCIHVYMTCKYYMCIVTLHIYIPV